MPLCATYPRQYRLRALWLGRRPCLGEGRVPSPSSSSPRARFARILQSKTGLGQPSSPTPILVFILVFSGKFLKSVSSFSGGAHPWARTPVAEMPEASNPSMCLPLPSHARTSRPRRTRGIAGGAPYKMLIFDKISVIMNSEDTKLVEIAKQNPKAYEDLYKK